MIPDPLWPVRVSVALIGCSISALSPLRYLATGRFPPNPGLFACVSDRIARFRTRGIHIGPARVRPAEVDLADAPPHMFTYMRPRRPTRAATGRPEVVTPRRGSAPRGMQGPDMAMGDSRPT
jgi:hypothetical protein